MLVLICLALALMCAGSVLVMIPALPMLPGILRVQAEAAARWFIEAFPMFDWKLKHNLIVASRIGR